MAILKVDHARFYQAVELKGSRIVQSLSTENDDVLEYDTVRQLLIFRDKKRDDVFYIPFTNIKFFRCTEKEKKKEVKEVKKEEVKLKVKTKEQIKEEIKEELKEVKKDFSNPPLPKL